MDSIYIGKKSTGGFSMIELMIVVVIVGIIAMVAMPSYQDYLIRGRIPDATSTLAAKSAQMEQFFQDNRTYASATPCTADTTTSQYFDFSCSGTPDATTFILQAVGKGSMVGFTYTIDQSGTKTSTFTVDGWNDSSTCWVSKKGETC